MKKISKSQIQNMIKKYEITKKIEIDEFLAEEIGIHLGDGSMNYYNGKGLYQLRGHKVDDKKHYETHIKTLYKNIYGIDVNIRIMDSTGVIGFQIWNDELVKFKHEILKLPLGKKGNFKIPKYINNKKLFFAFLRGLFDTDGTLYIETKYDKPYPRFEIKLTSQNTIKEIHKRLNKYGINCSFYEYIRKEKNWNNLYTVSIRGYKNCYLWVKYVGSNNPKNIQKLDKLLKYKGEPAVI